MSHRISNFAAPFALCALVVSAACDDATPPPPAAAPASAPSAGAAPPAPPAPSAPPNIPQLTPSEATAISAPVMVDPQTRAGRCVPVPERCNAVDDDCDGGIDEGLRNACGGCGPAPDELCNGADDDCDGRVDEQATGVGVDCATGQGACHQTGLTSCDDGALRCAVPAVIEPRRERCDTVDNDCDGAVDEGLSLGETCTAGRGACEATGVWICDAQGEGVLCAADPGDPQPERCNVVDDDCDGVIDEGVEVEGACVAGLGALCQREGGMLCGASGPACGAIKPSAGECAAERPTTISANDRFVCAVNQDAAVKCWGDARALTGVGPIVGDDPYEMGARLAPVDLDMHAQSVVVGADFACALSLDGRVKCWGENGSGQLGQGDRQPRTWRDMGDRLLPVDLAMRPVQIVAGADFACALDADGQVKCWGGNEAGSLGQGDRFNRGGAPGEMGAALPPVDLGDFTPVKLTAGDRHVCALDAVGAVKCWGSNTDRQIGQAERGDHRGAAPGELGDALPPLALGMPVIDIDAGADFTCAVGPRDQVKCWGRGFGQLVGINMQRFEATRIWAGAQRCAIDDAGDVQCWGFVDALPEQNSRMHRVELPLPVIELATSGTTTCALDVAGDLRCWGANTVGQLGQGDRVQRTSADAQALPAVPLHDEAL